MQLEFLPGGLLLGLTVLGGTLLLFGLALKALDWTIDASRDSALVGIVSGLRDWQMNSESDEVPARPTAVAMLAVPIEETVGPTPVLELVAPDQTRGRGES